LRRPTNEGTNGERLSTRIAAEELRKEHRLRLVHKR
jgi:hypothetical protein